MNNITKEQADYILAQLAKSTENKIIPVPKKDLDAFVNGWRAAEINLRDILNNYAKKEFPSIHMRPDHKDDMQEIKVYKTPCDNMGRECIVLFSRDDFIHFSPLQFKEFAMSINKILEYLEND